MASPYWHPRCPLPDGLVRPVPLDPDGLVGPTRGQARGRRWRRTSHGWYVPAEVDTTVVEQRILEQAARLPAGGALTGWAALRWRGGRYFTGLDPRTDAQLPVPVVLGGWRDLGRDDRIAVSRERFWWDELEVLDGVACAIPERALFDEVRRVGSLRGGVVAVDMACAAGLTSVAGMCEFLPSRNGWTGVPLVRRVLPLASDDSRSPQESRMRLAWVVDAGLPPPLCNKPLFDLRGNLLGVPDLLDPVAGLVGEYDGQDHTRQDRRRSDGAREHRLREHGLEYFELVGGDLTDIPSVVRRMHATRSRAAFLPPEQRRWTLDAPAWWRSAHPGG